jgi:hypothetical protein
LSVISLSDIVSDVTTATSAALASFLGQVKSSVTVLQIVGLTWDLDEDRSVRISTVTHSVRPLREQLEAHNKEVHFQGSTKVFKPIGGKRQVIGTINHVTTRQALEVELLEMLRLNSLQNIARGEEKESDLFMHGRRTDEARRVAQGIWNELTELKNNA